MTGATEQTQSVAELECRLAEVLAAKQTADAAPSIVVKDPATGKMVRSLKVKLTAEETQRVMALPPEERARMATDILMEHNQRKGVLKMIREMDRNKRKRERVIRKRQRKARRVRRSKG